MSAISLNLSLTSSLANSTLPPNPPASFKAEYPETMKSTTQDKITHLAYDAFSVFFFPLGLCRLIKNSLHNFAGTQIVPAQANKNETATLKACRELLLSKFNGKEVTLEAPDGVRLDGMYIPGKKDGQTLPQNARTVIYFNGNGENYEYQGLNFEQEWNLKDNQSIKISPPMSTFQQMAEKGYNVFLFNYRGVGRSQGHSTCKGLTLDGVSALQYIHNALNVPHENILLFGHSLGGSIATRVAALHPKVSLCNARSFSSLTEEVNALLGRNSAKIGKLAASLISSLGWELDSLKLWNRIENKKWCVFHPQDQVIFEEASLHHALIKQSGQKLVGTRMQDVQGLCEFYQRQAENQLNRPLTDDEIDVIKEFANETNNPHNRNLLPSELNEILSHF